MADNVAITEGSGTTVWTDEVTGSKHAQFVKLADGTADSATVIEAGNGTAAGALRVTIASDTTGVLSIDDNAGSITVDGTVTANLGATDNAVLDSIDTNTTTVAGAVSGTEMQVDVVAALPAGTNNIGDVDVASIVQPSTVRNGKKTVTSAGTAEAISTTQVITSGVTVKALAANTGIIYVGGSGVSSTTGFELAAGESVFIEIDDLDAVFIDASVSSEGVSYVAS